MCPQAHIKKWLFELRESTLLAKVKEEGVLSHAKAKLRVRAPSRGIPEGLRAR